MESLAIVVFILWSAVFLCGPLAVGVHHLRLPILAALLSLVSIWLGIFWCVHVYTWPRYLGLVSAACGLYVLWKTAERI